MIVPSRIPELFDETIASKINRNVAILTLVTGCAPIVSAMIQAATLGLSVHHALIVIALSWITVFAAIPAYNASVSRDSFLISFPICLPFWRSHRRDEMPSEGIENQWLTPNIRPLFYCHSFQFSLTAAFGIWLFKEMDVFDHLHDDQVCSSTAMVYLYGRHVHAFDHLFVVTGFWVNIIMVVPGFNVILFTSIFLWPYTCSASILASSRFRNFPHRRYPLSRFVVDFAVVVLPSLMVVFIIIAIEGQVAINLVTQGENQWSFGQTLAMLTLVVTIWGLYRSLRTFRGTILSLPTNRSDTIGVPQAPRQFL